MKVVAVKKNPSDQTIIAFKLEDGSVLNYDECLSAVELGLMPDLMLGRARDGGLTIRGVADGDPSNNLQNLPTF